MSIGPVEYLIVGFPGNQFTGEIAPTLADLIENETIRVLDLVFLAKDADGDVLVFEFDQHEGLAAFAALDGETGGVINNDDIAYASAVLEPDTSAALIVWEDVWATPFANALRNSGGVLIEGGRVPHDIAEAVFADLPAAV